MLVDMWDEPTFSWGSERFTVRPIDVVPTVLELLELTPPDVEGRSLTVAIDGGELGEPDAAERGVVDSGGRPGHPRRRGRR